MSREVELQYSAKAELGAIEWRNAGECCMQKLVCAGAILLLMIDAAAAQSGFGLPFKQKAPPPSKEQIERRKAADKAYDAAIQKIPEKKSSADPWGDVRPSSPAAARNKRQ